MTRHTLSVLVENKPGVLTRVSALFARRAFNIHSLAVGPTEYPEISRITVVVDVESNPLEQVTKQLNKLVNVIKIVELAPTSSVQRERSEEHTSELQSRGHLVCRLLLEQKTLS